MRKSTVIALTALVLGACSNDAVSPPDSFLGFDEAAELSFAGSFVGDPRGNFLGPLHRLPDSLKLSSAQETQVKALVEAFLQAVKADHEALAAIWLEARAAHDAGKSREEIRAILERGLPIRQRIAAAEQKLRTDILAVLTAEQKAWLEANRPRQCTAPALTEEQKTQISGLVAAFKQANQADLAAIKAALEQARAAHRQGASRDEIRAILDAVRPAMERVAAAQRVLRAAIDAILTPEQRACHGLPGPRPMRGPGR